MPLKTTLLLYMSQKCYCLNSIALFSLNCFIYVWWKQVYVMLLFRVLQEERSSHNDSQGTVRLHY